MTAVASQVGRVSWSAWAIEIVEAAQEIAVRIDQHEHPQVVRLLDGQHARRRPAETPQLSHEAEGGMQRVRSSIRRQALPVVVLGSTATGKNSSVIGPRSRIIHPLSLKPTANPSLR